MASFLRAIAAKTKYEPSPTFLHYTVPVGRKLYSWGGCKQDFSEIGKGLPKAVIETFDPFTEVWEQCATSGVSPLGVYNGACAAVGYSMYVSCGYDGSKFYSALHQFDTTTLQWHERMANSSEGPMRKSSCQMISCEEEKLALFGGYGFPTGPTQPGSKFIRSTKFVDGRGWSNEFHLFHIREGIWSSPDMTGDRPPPCSHFSFTAIGPHRAVLFGGYQPKRGEVNDAYILDTREMKWFRIPNTGRGPWPVSRARHAACCINYGEQHPQLLVTGGVDKDGKTLRDGWILDVDSGIWKEIPLPDDVQPRCWHTITASTLGPGLIEVTMFGGCPLWATGKTSDDIPKLSETTVLQFESVEVQSFGGISREWVLVSVGNQRQLGSPERLREKLGKIGQHNASINHERIATLEQRVQESERTSEEAERGRVEANRRLHVSELRARDLESQLEHRRQELERMVQEAERERQDLERRVQEAEGRSEAAERKRQDLERRVQEAEGRSEAAERERQELERRVQEAEGRSEAAERGRQELERRVQEADRGRQEAEERVEGAEGRVQEMEGRAQEAERRQEEEQSFWVVQREEIQLTEEELGRGGWAVVRVATFRGTRVAAKCLHQLIISRHNRGLFIREMTMAARIRHPNLLQFIGATLHGELIVLTELMPTSLRAVLGEANLTQQQITSISLDVARALNYLHLMRPNAIIHRDISSSNVLLDPAPNNTWRAKVSDYGSVNLLRKLQTGAPGNPTYAAPEAEFPSRQSPKMDIFSFGVLLIETCTAQFPDIDIRERLLQSIQDRGMVDLIRQCLAEDIDTRPTASGIITRLSEL